MKLFIKNQKLYKNLCIMIGFILLLLTPFFIYIIINNLHGKDLIIVLSGSKETFNNNEYYRSICPYTNIKCETFTLPYHNKKNPFKYWNSIGMEKIVNMTNSKIKKLQDYYKPTRLILSGISRGGYLASMYKNADIYLLFSPVIKWKELNEFDNEGPEIDIHHLKTKRVFGFVNSNDYRINGSIVVDFFDKLCENNKICKNRNKKIIIEEGTLHSVPKEVFKKGANWIIT